ncbi:hypothetical protein DY000_02012505 [Brassica cretica]|uniref:Uncharacterized protein n=1 Tax=Brassica cretica TaxID=69181 RepID=A0ABQ7D9C9_BRACR|nr:hypothetical protein DY000_02012505 [Brassica cretica]
MSLERSKQICPSVSVTDLRVVFKRSAPFHFVDLNTTLDNLKVVEFAAKFKHCLANALVFFNTIRVKDKQMLCSKSWDTINSDSLVNGGEHKQRELLRDFIETTASVFIQQQRRRTTQIFEEDDEDDVLSNNLSVKTNRSQNQIHELEDPHDQVKDFVGALIYDDYEDDFCRDPCHNTDVKSKEVDMSPQSRLISPIDIHEINGDMTRETLFDRPIVTRDIPCIDPLFNDEDEVQGFNNGGDFHVVVDDDNICVLKEHINYGLGEKDCHQQFHRKPPDRDRHKGLTNGFEYPKLLDETWHILKPEHGQEDCCYNDEFSYAASMKWISEWVRQENKLCWSLIFRATVSHVDLSVDLIKVKFERVRSYLCFVVYSRCVVTYFCSDVVLVFKDIVEHRHRSVSRATIKQEHARTTFLCQVRKCYDELRIDFPSHKT